MAAPRLIRLVARPPDVGWGECLQVSTHLPSISQSNLAAELLNEYQHQRAKSVVGRIMAAARQLQGRVDRLVIMGDESQLLPARAFFNTGCHPYHNELSRGERAGYPRIYFVGDRLDNDQLQGLLHLLGNGRVTESLDNRWGMIVIEPASNASRLLISTFLSSVRTSCENDEQRVRERMIVLQETNGRCAAAENEARFDFPAARSIQPLSPIGLLPAALMGLDILRFLQGAHELAQHLEQAPTTDNLAAKFLSIDRHLRANHNITRWTLRWWDPSLAALATWMKQFLPPSTDGERFLRINLLVDRPRCDPLLLDNEPVPALVAAGINVAHEADRHANRPAVDLILPSTQIGVLGQLFQLWLVLANSATTA